jgi:hypothetical protein
MNLLEMANTGASESLQLARTVLRLAQVGLPRSPCRTFRVRSQSLGRRVHVWLTALASTLNDRRQEHIRVPASLQSQEAVLVDRVILTVQRVLDEESQGPHIVEPGALGCKFEGLPTFYGSPYARP